MSTSKKENIRESKAYKSMTNYLACAIAEGFCEGEGASVEEQKAAWQFLVDTGAAWHLQGLLAPHTWYGRNAAALIKQGVIEKPNKEHKDAYGNIVAATE